MSAVRPPSLKEAVAIIDVASNEGVVIAGALRQKRYLVKGLCDHDQRDRVDDLTHDYDANDVAVDEDDVSDDGEGCDDADSDPPGRAPTAITTGEPAVRDTNGSAALLREMMQGCEVLIMNDVVRLDMTIDDGRRRTILETAREVGIRKIIYSTHFTVDFPYGSPLPDEMVWGIAKRHHDQNQMIAKLEADIADIAAMGNKGEDSSTEAERWCPTVKIIQPGLINLQLPPGRRLMALHRFDMDREEAQPLLPPDMRVAFISAVDFRERVCKIVEDLVHGRSTVGVERLYDPDLTTASEVAKSIRGSYQPMDDYRPPPPGSLDADTARLVVAAFSFEPPPAPPKVAEVAVAIPDAASYLGLLAVRAISNMTGVEMHGVTDPTGSRWIDSIVENSKGEVRPSFGTMGGPPKTLNLRGHLLETGKREKAYLVLSDMIGKALHVDNRRRRRILFAAMKAKINRIIFLSRPAIHPAPGEGSDICAGPQPDRPHERPLTLKAMQAIGEHRTEDELDARFTDDIAIVNLAARLAARLPAAYSDIGPSSNRLVNEAAAKAREYARNGFCPCVCGRSSHGVVNHAPAVRWDPRIVEIPHFATPHEFLPGNGLSELFVKPGEDDDPIRGALHPVLDPGMLIPCVEERKFEETLQQVIKDFDQYYEDRARSAGKKVVSADLNEPDLQTVADLTRRVNELVSPEPEATDVGRHIRRFLSARLPGEI